VGQRRARRTATSLIIGLDLGKTVPDFMRTISSLGTTVTKNGSMIEKARPRMVCGPIDSVERTGIGENTSS
jgi:hypothetical protein